MVRYVTTLKSGGGGGTCSVRSYEIKVTFVKHWVSLLWVFPFCFAVPNWMVPLRLCGPHHQTKREMVSMTTYSFFIRLQFASIGITIKIKTPLWPFLREELCFSHQRVCKVWNCVCEGQRYKEHLLPKVCFHRSLRFWWEQNKDPGICKTAW